MTRIGYVEKRVYEVIRLTARAGDPMPRNAEIAEEVGLKTPRHVGDALKKLRAAGLISYTSNRGHRGPVTVVATGDTTRERYGLWRKAGAAHGNDFSLAHRLQMQREIETARGRGAEDFGKAVDNAGCLYISGDPQYPNYEVCGAPRIKGFSYCPDHYAVCYKPAEEVA